MEFHLHIHVQGVQEILPPLPRKHWADIGYTEIGQPIGVTVHSHHSHCVESFDM